jgi:hypothetical protein
MVDCISLTVSEEIRYASKWMDEIKKEKGVYSGSNAGNEGEKKHQSF